MARCKVQAEMRWLGNHACKACATALAKNSRTSRLALIVPQYQLRHAPRRTGWQLQGFPAEGLFRLMLPAKCLKFDLHFRALSSHVIEDALCLHANIAK